MNGIAAERAARLLGSAGEREVLLGPLTTYGVGGPARLFARVGTEADLALVHSVVAESRIPVLVVGKGSNLLVADRGFDGLAISLGGCFAEVEVDGVIVRAGGGASLPVVARKAAAAGLAGLEWAVGVPGSVGGAVRMNAGGHGSDMAGTLVRVRVLDVSSGEDIEVPASSLGLAYRHSDVGPQQVVLRADFELVAGERGESEAVIAGIVSWRRENQPGGHNAGSVFTNPPGDSAGRLVEECGLKGYRIGSAEVSSKHANFIQVDPDGSAGDVVALMALLRARVREMTGIELVAETKLVGFTRAELEGVTG